MKMTIAWHQKCMENVRASLARDAENIARMQVAYALGKKRADFYDQQILTATDQGKDGFDAGKFMCSKKKITP